MKRNCFLVLLTLFITINLSGFNRFDKHVAETLAEIAKSGDDTSLSEITSYEWDRMYVIGPYQSFECSIVKGLPNKVKKRIKSQELVDDCYVLLFTLNKNFVSCSEVGSKTIVELGIKRASAYGPTSVVPFKDEGPMIIDVVNDKRPMFDGERGVNKLNKWIEDNLRYPEEAKKAGIQGRVTIGFTITKEGRLTNVKVLRGCHPLLDAEAVRVIETTAKKWSGAYSTSTGERSDFSYVYPVIFRL